jgi:hypothetical protein
MAETITFKMTGSEGFNNKVLAIKGFRKLSGAGLKEAKEFVEQVQAEVMLAASVPVTAVQEDAEDAIRMMEEGGIKVDRTFKQSLNAIIEKLKGVAVDAIEANQLELAKEILSLAIENDRW